MEIYIITITTTVALYLLWQTALLTFKCAFYERLFERLKDEGLRIETVDTVKRINNPFTFMRLLKKK